MSGTVWIPSVPLPFLGFRTDKCWSCGKKFRGRGRMAVYQLHYRREHEPDDDGSVQMEVTRAEAERIYREVQARP